LFGLRYRQVVLLHAPQHDCVAEHSAFDVSEVPLATAAMANVATIANARSNFLIGLTSFSVATS
jgi:hypothetical protein